MQLPDRDAFSDFFAAEDDEWACARRHAFFNDHEESAQTASSRDDYQSTFMSVYGIHIDWREGIFSLLEGISLGLGDAVFSTEFDYDSDVETATANVAGVQHVFHHYSLGSEEYDAEQARIEHLLLTRGYALRVHTESLMCDMLSFLLMPVSAWQYVEQQFGTESVSKYFVPYASQCAAPDSEPPAPTTPLNASPRPVPFEIRLALIGFWCGFPVLVGFLLYVLWGILTRTEPLPLPQPKGCENVEKIHARLRPEVAEPLKAQMRKSLGCEAVESELHR